MVWTIQSMLGHWCNDTAGTLLWCHRIYAQNAEKQHNKTCEQGPARPDMDEMLMYKAMIKMDEIRQHYLF